MLMRTFGKTCRGWGTPPPYSLVASREPMAAFKNLSRLAIGLGSHQGSHHHNEEQQEEDEEENWGWNTPNTSSIGLLSQLCKFSTCAFLVTELSTGQCPGFVLHLKVSKILSFISLLSFSRVFCLHSDFVCLEQDRDA